MIISSGRILLRLQCIVPGDICLGIDRVCDQCDIGCVGNHQERNNAHQNQCDHRDLDNEHKDERHNHDENITKNKVRQPFAEDGKPIFEVEPSRERFICNRMWDRRADDDAVWK